MKRMLIVLLLVTLLLCGCGRKPGENFAESERFTIVSGENPNVYYETVIVDNNTGVMYLALYGYHHFGITPLLNADGTPMLIKEGTGG